MHWKAPHSGSRAEINLLVSPAWGRKILGTSLGKDPWENRVSVGQMGRRRVSPRPLQDDRSWAGLGIRASVSRLKVHVVIYGGMLTLLSF